MVSGPRLTSVGRGPGPFLARGNGTRDLFDPMLPLPAGSKKSRSLIPWNNERLLFFLLLETTNQGLIRQMESNPAGSPSSK